MMHVLDFYTMLIGELLTRKANSVSSSWVYVDVKLGTFLFFIHGIGMPIILTFGIRR